MIHWRNFFPRPRVLAAFVLVAGLPWAAAGSTPPPAGALVPFVLPWDDASPGVTDVSGWNAVPAGKAGYVFAADGHLWLPDTGETTGRRRIRFLGVNTSFAANFPTHDEAGRIAAHLAKFGVNCVRFHHMDRDAAPKGLWRDDLKTLDPGQLDRLDYFFSQLKARGIYADLNLHVSRVYPDLPVWEGMPPFHKGVDLFVPEMIASQKAFARDLLHHVNPYTGLAYAQDPAVAFVEINNENGLVSRWWEKSLDGMPEFYTHQLAGLWVKWRRDHGLPAGDGAIILRREYETRAERLRQEWIQFLWDTERAYWREMKRYLREELGVRAVVVGTQLYSYSALPLQAEMDAVDIHAYWQHPEFPDRANRNIWTVGNESMVNHPDAKTISDLALQRVAGKPLIVTEYNHSAPNTYGAEAFLMIAAYASLQDWDAFFAYSYAHGNQPWNAGMINGNFDIYTHSAKMVTLPIAAALFRRADVSTPTASQTVEAAEADFVALTGRYGVNIGAQHFGASRQDALRRPQLLRLGAPAKLFTTPPQTSYAGPIISDNQELRWDAAGPRGRFTIDTPRTKGVVGFVDGEDIQLGNLVVRAGPTRQGWAAIAIAQMDGRELGEPGRCLLVACGDLQNSGQKWKTPAQDSLSAWGSAPVVVESVAAQITLRTAHRVQVWALDERGQRRSALAVERVGEVARFDLGGANRTLWYEVLVDAP